MPDVQNYSNLKTSAFSSYTERLAAYSYIQKEVSSRQAVIRSLQQWHNSLSLVHRLPPELLCRVFKFVVDSDRRRGRRWLRNVTHVCSHWRLIALDYPTLWTRISFKSLSWAKEMLSRSRMAPLEISAGNDEASYYTYDDKRIKLLHVILKQLGRIRSLALSDSCFPTPYAFSKLIQLIDVSAPLLESCTIFFGDRETRNILPKNAFIDCPRLSRLRLERCGLMNWMAASLSNLNSLSIIDIPRKIRPPIDQFVFALSAMTRLKQLHLSCSFALPSQTNTSFRTIANLPLLQSLIVISGLSDSEILLDHIAHPTTTWVKIRATQIPDDQVSSAQRLSKTLCDRFPNPIDINILQDQIILRTLESHPLYYQLNLRIEKLSSTGYAVQVLQTFLQNVSFRNLTSIWVLDGEVDWLSFGNLEHLMEVGVGWDCSEAFVEALCNHASATHEQSRESSSSVTFPGLRVLKLFGWDFGIQQDRRLRIERLIEGLITRRANLPSTIVHLTLENCQSLQGPYEDRLAKLANVTFLEAANPTLICLEESDESDSQSLESDDWASDDAYD